MRIEDVWKDGGISRTDAEVLLAKLLRKNRPWIFAHDDEEIPADRRDLLAEWIKRRRGGEPVAYVVGEKEFFGRTFKVDSRVLIPRPETEGLVRLTLDILDGKACHPDTVSLGNHIVACADIWKTLDDVRTVVDIGTGSGCIAIAIALERPDFSVIATDMSENALAIAQQNAALHGVANRIEFRRGSLLDPIQDLKKEFLIVSNPPYVPDGYALPAEVTFEPKEALFGGEKGDDLLGKLAKQAHAHSACAGIVLEHRSDQISIVSPHFNLLLSLAKNVSSRRRRNLIGSW